MAYPTAGGSTQYLYDQNGNVIGQQDFNAAGLPMEAGMGPGVPPSAAAGAEAAVAQATGRATVQSHSKPPPTPPPPTGSGGGGSGGGGGGGGLLGGSGTGWAGLTQHDQRLEWGRVNSIYEKYLGKKASMAEAEAVYNSGLSDYSLEQQLIMSPAFTKSPMFHQLENEYAYELRQYVGTGFRLTAKQVQAFAAHNYTSTDLQSWVAAHPNIYVHSNEFRSRVDEMLNTFQSVMGYDPYASNGVADTNAKVKKGQIVGTSANPLIAHAYQAALNFQTADQYKAWLESTPQGRARALGKTNPNPGTHSDAGLTLDAQGRPVMQGQAPESFKSSAGGADVGFGGSGDVSNGGDASMAEQTPPSVVDQAATF